MHCQSQLLFFAFLCNNSSSLPHIGQFVFSKFHSFFKNLITSFRDSIFSSYNSNNRKPKASGAQKVQKSALAFKIFVKQYTTISFSNVNRQKIYGNNSLKDQSYLEFISPTNNITIIIIIIQIIGKIPVCNVSIKTNAITHKIIPVSIPALYAF